MVPTPFPYQPDNLSTKNAKKQLAIATKQINNDPWNKPEPACQKDPKTTRTNS